MTTQEIRRALGETNPDDGLATANLLDALCERVGELEARIPPPAPEAPDDRCAALYARGILAALAGVVPTPERGYEADGGPSLAASDLRQMREVHDRYSAALQAIANIIGLYRDRTICAEDAVLRTARQVEGALGPGCIPAGDRKDEQCQR